MVKIKEIGGFFELDEFIKNEYYKELIALNTGRNALIYIMKAKNIKKLYIPYYLCDSIGDILTMNNYEFKYYNVDSKFMPIFNKILTKDEYLYIVNYYGQLNKDNIIYLKHQYKQIIVDNTHAFFQKPIRDIDTIYSCRKFFGVPDGAYLSTNIKINDDLGKSVSKDRMVHVLGRYEGLASEYYTDFRENDKSFKIEPLRYMSKLTHNILGAIDYNIVCNIRNENYAYLHRNLRRYNKLSLIVPNGPFTYPFFVENGIEIRKVLAKLKIYIPTLWPNILTTMPEDSIEYRYATSILPLPCDQRYTVEDMKYLTNYIREVIKDG